MKTVGIIAEYNPFHNGHKYQIQKAKELTGADIVIVIMSGNFTQQGNIAVADKFKRAEMAIKNGADVVIELPTLYATSSAEIFAHGAVNILDKLNTIDYLVFGTESDNVDILNSIVNKITTSKQNIDENIQKEMQNGISYASARDNILKQILTEDEYIQISKPNNILAIEYLKALKEINSKITPIAIKRQEANHNDESIDSSSLFASATSIRNEIEKNGLDSVLKTIPQDTYDILSDSNIVFNENMFNFIRHKIKLLDKLCLKYIYDVSEGLENKIYDAIITSKNYTDLINNIKSKRYTMSRIKRILIHLLLDITKYQYQNLSNVHYARILKANKQNNILSTLNKNSSIPVISNINDKYIDKLDDKIKQSLLLDINSTNIYQIICNNNLNIDKTNMI